MPQASIDPVVMAEAAVVTLGSLQAGTKENIILDEAVISSILVGSLGDRKMPAAANSHEPEPEAEDRARNRHRGRREP